MNRDFSDLLSAFCDAKVEFLVVGAHAVAAHGHVRATKDLDLWIRPDPKNSSRVFEALVEFGAPLFDLQESELAEPGLILQLGVPPIRIDILTSLAGLDFEQAWKERGYLDVEGKAVPLISKRCLLENKRAVGRYQDLADVEALEGQTGRDGGQ